MRDRFEMLFTHNVDGVFFMMFEEPIRWGPDVDREALLDYAFEHLRLTAVNPMMCQQLGATREQLIGTAPRDRWHHDPTLWRYHIPRLFDDGRMFIHSRGPRSDGTWYDVEGEYVCLYDDDGRITGYFGTQRDVTEKRKMAERLELAMVGGEIGIWDLDLVNDKLFFNEHWPARFGYADEPRASDPRWWASLIHAADLAEVGRLFHAHLAGETPSYRVEYRLRTAKGEWAWIMAHGRVSTRAPDGKPLRMVGTTVDVTERKLLQERLFLSERMASIGTLAAGVGHEINNPLTYIVLNLALLDRELGALPEEPRSRARSMLAQARYGTERVSAIVRDLQALTRVPDERPARVDLDGIIDRCLDIADHQIRHRARVIRELGGPPCVSGSEGRIVQLLLNLIVNAAQAIVEGAADHHWIRITTSTTSDGRALVAIADNGVGMSGDVVARIFDPFFTTKAVGEGTGLGLAICRNIVTALGGEIQVDSAPGVGTTFRVLLPPAPLDASAPQRRLRVLVVDDEAMVGQLVERVLPEHEVHRETSARAALQRLQAGERFDRILCDLMMPDTSGMDFYDQLAGIDLALREQVVFLSGGVFTERARVFLDQVPNRRLAKPFGIEALAAVLVDEPS